MTRRNKHIFCYEKSSATSSPQATYVTEKGLHTIVITTNCFINMQLAKEV
jgi:hypothetical protein